MSGKDLHKKPEFDSVATPDWLLRLFDGFHDPLQREKLDQWEVEEDFL